MSSSKTYVLVTGAPSRAASEATYRCASFFTTRKSAPPCGSGGVCAHFGCANLDVVFEIFLAFSEVFHPMSGHQSWQSLCLKLSKGKQENMKVLYNCPNCSQI